jgi:hypothetical protein
MGRRDESGARSRCRGAPGSHIQPLGIDLDRVRLHPGRGQRFARQWMARILDPDLAARWQKRAHDKVDRVLRAAGDDDLSRIAAHGTRVVEIGRSGAA